MTAEFKYLMQLMGFAATGHPVSAPDEDIDWNLLFSLAQQQQILPLICHGIDTQGLHSCPDTLSMVVAHCARTGSIIALLEEMNAAGLPCYVVKGFAAGIHYAAPEFRLSGDTDIVIAPEDEDRVCAYLTEQGFSLRPRWEHGHHAVATHPKMGILEVHVHLYDELIGQVWFKGLDTQTLLQEPKRLIHTPDGAYWTLGATDHAIYMALHMVKHFILSGNSLRMMMDVALALKSAKNPVDMERFWSTMDALHYGTLLRNILWGMVLYCGFSQNDFPGIGSCDKAAVRQLLDDLESGGWIGRNEQKVREESWQEYNRQLLLKQKSKLQYGLYILNWNHSFRLRTIFPGKKRLSRDYPVVLKYPFLIPAVWLHRILFKGTALLRSGGWTRGLISSGDKLCDESRARVALFRRLEMME